MMNDYVETYRKRLGELAYERLRLVRRLDELDRQIVAYEAALEAAERIKRTNDTEAAISAAKEK